MWMKNKTRKKNDVRFLDGQLEGDEALLLSDDDEQREFGRRAVYPRRHLQSRQLFVHTRRNIRTVLPCVLLVDTSRFCVKQKHVRNCCRLCGRCPRCPSWWGCERWRQWADWTRARTSSTGERAAGRPTPAALTTIVTTWFDFIQIWYELLFVLLLMFVYYFAKLLVCYLCVCVCVCVCVPRSERTSERANEWGYHQ